VKSGLKQIHPVFEGFETKRGIFVIPYNLNYNDAAHFIQFDLVRHVLAIVGTGAVGIQ
jgi:hypothetical protein